MTRMSKVTNVETLACDGGWRNYHFVRLSTEDGIIGWSEYDEGFDSPGVGAAIQHLSSRVVGQNVFQHERIYAELFAATRPAASGVVAQALGAIENTLLDAKAKLLDVPCYELLGGKVRDRIRVYWSHPMSRRCARIRQRRRAGVSTMGAKRHSRARQLARRP